MSSKWAAILLLCAAPVLAVENKFSNPQSGAADPLTVLGPASACVDNQLARWNGASNTALQCSPLTVADTTGDITAPGALTISTAGSNGDITLDPHDTGQTVITDIGTVANPALAFNNSKNSGFYLRGEATNILNLGLNGSEFIEWQSSGGGTVGTFGAQIGPPVWVPKYLTVWEENLGNEAISIWSFQYSTPPALRLYAARDVATVANPLNYERLSLSTTAGTGATIAVETAGTGGDNLSLTLKPAGTEGIYAGANGITSATPAGVVLNATGGSGTDVAGASLTIAGGKGTGNAAGGSVVIQTSDAGASGTTLQTLTDVAVFDASRDVTFYSLGGNGATNFEGLKLDHTVGTGTALSAVTGGTGQDDLSLVFKPAGVGEFYLGADGITDATPVYARVNATGGSGTDVAGASLIIAGGKGTGNAAGGSVVIQTSDAGASGTTLQTLATRVTVGVERTTIANILSLTGIAAAPGSPAAGDIVYDSVNNLFCGYNGSAWISFSGAGNCWRK